MSDLYDAGTKKKKKDKGIFDWLEELKDEAVASGKVYGDGSAYGQEAVAKAKAKIKKRKKEESEN
jgi:hypothetical protein